VGKLEMSQHAYSKIDNNDIKLDRGSIEYSSKILDVETFDLISFDDNLGFYNCSQSGKFQTFNNNFPTEIKKSFNYRINHVEKEVLFLMRNAPKKLNFSVVRIYFIYLYV
jgi:hypothetical protein